MNKFTAEIFKAASEKPVLFYKSHTKDLWTDPHIAKQMLETHLDPGTDLASYKHETIDRAVGRFMKTFLSDAGKTHIDLGCGPGLYVSRLAVKGINTTGLDFSENSVNYARKYAEENSLNAEYILGSYFDLKLKKKFDFVTLISCDICAMSEEQLDNFLGSVKGLLKSGGTFLFDFQTLEDFRQFTEYSTWNYYGDGGFFSDKEHAVLEKRFRYEEEKATCSKNTIIFHDGTVKDLSIFHRYYSTEMIGKILDDAGFTITGVYGSICGDPLPENPKQITVTAEHK